MAEYSLETFFSLSLVRRLAADIARARELHPARRATQVEPVVARRYE